VPNIPETSYIVIATLGQLRAHQHGLFGYCNDCGDKYGMDVPAERRRGGLFDIDLDALIAERGADCRIVGLPPVPCPRCGSTSSATRITAPSRPR
jgi:hypothetical protein